MVATLYNWLKFLHVLAAITWVGGAIALQVLGTRIYRAGNRERLYEMAGDFEFIGTRVFMPASLLLLGLGIWMVIIGPWNFGMTWIDLGLAMFAYSFVSGAFYLGPQLNRGRPSRSGRVPGRSRWPCWSTGCSWCPGSS